ncbi:MAG: hypothetical protein COC06_10355 [Bacteroidales bacterium]|nr:hypothetical protein [Labilibaculum sp.]PCH67944.1 MAG: hypothetical protein COC06_10355 [Bacteroidales bacterium]
MELEELLSKKRVGDIGAVALIIGETRTYTAVLLRRKNAKKHLKAISALTHLIKTRERIIKKIVQ